MANLLPTDPFPSLKRFVEHNIELPVAELLVHAAQEAALRAAVDGRSSSARAWCTCCAAGRRTADLLDPARLPVLRPRFPGARSAPAVVQLQPGLVQELLRHRRAGRELRGGTDRRGSRSGWSSPGRRRRACGTCLRRACHGARLNPVALHLRFRERSIAELTALPVAAAARAFFEQPAAWRARGAIARDALAEIRSRVWTFWSASAWATWRSTARRRRLSGGEAQRIRLAAQLGSNLQGVCYVLDEPTIGLHPRDNQMLLEALDQLSAAGNTLVVVEHDEDTIRRADHIIDLGPGAGVRGGRVVAAGTAQAAAAQPAIGDRPLSGAAAAHPATPRRATNERSAAHRDRVGAACTTCAIWMCASRWAGWWWSPACPAPANPRWRAMCSMPTCARWSMRSPRPSPSVRARLRGVEQIARVLEVDQTPIGRTPRSCPATYVGFWDEIRRVFAGTSEARVRGYDASRFSFNTSGGRCPDCEGAGTRTIEMSFLPDVKVLCERCGGSRFDRETLEIQWRGRSVGDVLAMNVEEAVEFFAAHPRIARPLALLADVGLGYLTLGQPVRRSRAAKRSASSWSPSWRA